MINGNRTDLAAFIKIACAILFLSAGSGCSDEPITITGRVLDESGASVSGVAVSACYLGWGWSGHQLVWDKDYCSETVQTNSGGSYVINFRGLSLHA